MTPTVEQLMAKIAAVVLEATRPEDRIMFKVDGPPQAWQRDNIVRVGKFIRNVKPAETRKAQERIRWLFQEAAPGHRPWARPLVVLLHFYVPDRRHRDWDNLAKTVTDALNKLAYSDDTQIVLAPIGKSLDRVSPCTMVTLCAFPWDHGNPLFPKAKKSAARGYVRNLKLTPL